MEDLNLNVKNKIQKFQNNTSEENQSSEFDDTIAELETKKSSLLKAIHPNFSSTIFFQYNSDASKLQNNSTIRKSEIIWKDSVLTQMQNKTEFFVFGITNFLLFI